MTQHRRRRSSTGATGSTSSPRCRGTATTRRARAGGAGSCAHEDTAVGSHHPRAPVPDRQDQHPGPGRWPSAGSPAEAAVLGGGHAGAGPTSSWPCRRRSPSASPAGRVARLRRAPFVFNIQDVFPDVAVELGILTNPRVIAAAASARAGRATRLADAVTVLSDDLRDNVVAKLAGHRRGDAGEGAGDPQLRRHRAHHARPTATTPTAQELGLVGKTVVLYAGNVGLQPEPRPAASTAARRSADRRPDVVFVVNGGGSGPADLERRGRRGLPNVRFGDFQPTDAPRRGAGRRRHPPRAAQARASPRPACRRSSTRSSPPAGRCWPASTRAPRSPARSSAGRCRHRRAARGPRRVLRRPRPRCSTTPTRRAAMGERGRRFVEGWASPAAVAEQLRGAVRGAARLPRPPAAR